VWIDKPSQADAFRIEKTEPRKDNARGETKTLEFLLFIVLNIIIFIILLFIYHICQNKYICIFNIYCVLMYVAYPLQSNAF